VGDDISAHEIDPLRPRANDRNVANRDRRLSGIRGSKALVRHGTHVRVPLSVRCGLERESVGGRVAREGDEVRWVVSAWTSGW
jgi:hypothetical protein